MKLVKRLTAVALMACIAATGTFAFAVNQKDVATESTQSSETEVMPLQIDFDFSDDLAGSNFTKTFQCSWTYPWYKVWIRNTGSHDMKVDIGDKVSSETIKAGQTKSYIFKTGVLSRKVTVSIWGALGYDIEGEIAIKTAESDSDFG